MKPSEDLNQAVAGATAGCLTAIITCPLDVIKTRIQNKAYGTKSPLALLKKIWSQERLHGLYRGLQPTVIGYLPTWTIYFVAYDRSKRYFQNRPETSQYIPIELQHVLSASMAGACSTIGTNPLWVIKTRIMTQTPRTINPYTSVPHAFRRIAAEEGWRAFYKGLLPSMFGLAHVAVQFPLYEALKKEMEHRNFSHPMTVLTASMLSKTVASILTYPHEVIRTRFHTESTPPKRYTSVPVTVKLIFSQEGGWRAFYNGFGTNLLRTVPASAITLAGYETIIHFLHHFQRDSS